jgi:hypothetical protein
VDLILLDWTRMGKTYCVAGAVADGKGFKIVRPLWAKNQRAPVRNVGWSPYQLDGHTRWEVFELIGPVTAAAEPPHLEDLWVRTLQPRRQLASPACRRAILEATLAKSQEALFGFALTATRTAAYLSPGAGHRSLATILVRSSEITFDVVRRSEEPDVRVILPVPDLGRRTLPVKDHHLLQRFGQANTVLNQLGLRLTQAIREMGEWVVVRLGLSRAFQSASSQAAMCWLMADGFFSLANPMP